MNTQLIIVLILVSLAGLYILRSMWRTWFASAKSGCSSGCGGNCNSAKTPKESVKGRIPLKQI